MLKSYKKQIESLQKQLEDAHKPTPSSSSSSSSSALVDSNRLAELEIEKQKISETNEMMAARLAEEEKAKAQLQEKIEILKKYFVSSTSVKETELAKKAKKARREVSCKRQNHTPPFSLQAFSCACHLKYISIRASLIHLPRFL